MGSERDRSRRERVDQRRPSRGRPGLERSVWGSLPRWPRLDAPCLGSLPTRGVALPIPPTPVYGDEQEEPYRDLHSGITPLHRVQTGGASGGSSMHRGGIAAERIASPPGARNPFPTI